MKILIFGESGQLSQQFKNLIPYKNVLQIGRDRVDFLSPQTVINIINEYKPTHIINAAAYTKVDKAESEKELALKINGEILSVIGEQAKKNNAFVFHFSTDYVFNGEKLTEYIEADPTDPINYYGYTKLVGEQNLINSGCRHIILRIAWIYSPYGQNFLKTILRIAENTKELSVVNDQIGTPTSAYDVTSNVIKIMHDPNLQSKVGLYHMAPKGSVSWCGFAQKILEHARTRADKFNVGANSLRSITSEEFKTPAKRPHNSRLSSEKLKSTFGIELPHWEDSLQKVFKNL